MYVGRFWGVRLIHHERFAVGQQRIDLKHTLSREVVQGLLRVCVAAFQVRVRRRAEERRPLLGGVGRRVSRPWEAQIAVLLTNLRRLLGRHKLRKRARDVRVDAIVARGCRLGLRSLGRRRHARELAR
eukprot:6212418-Pleurochrysis_carterae.AAC.1